MAEKGAIYIGIRGTVLTLDAALGTEIWRTLVRGADFVNVALVDGRLYASSRGELYAIDPATGQILWNNKLKGLGTGLVTIAGSNQVPPAAVDRQRKQAATAAAGATAAGA
jgi:outer membrane protein assembly factor BamB